MSRKGGQNSPEKTGGPLASRVWSRACGDLGYVGEVVLTRVAFPEHDTTIPCQMAKSNDPGRFFRFFSSVGRTAFGGRPLAFVGRRQRKAPDIGKFFAGQTDSGGEIAPSSWVTNPRARTFAPWWDWRTHNIHHVIMMSSEHERKSRRIHGALRTGLRASGSACHGTFLTAFSGRLAAFRSILLHNRYFALSSFARC